MKHLLTICFLSFGLLSIQAQPDAITSHFSKFQDREDFTSVNIGKRMFEMMSSVDIEMNDADAKEVADIIKSLVGLRILSSDTAPEGFYRDAKNTLVSNSYEELMTVKDGNQDIHFYVNEDEKGVNELVLLTNEGSEVVIMSFLGNLDMSKISKLSKTLNIDGAEHLGKLKERQ